MASFLTADVKLAAKVLEKEHGKRYYEYILETYENSYRQDDWLLCYEFNGIKPVRIAWEYAHYVIQFPRKVNGKIKYGYQIIQVNKLKAYNKPPFKIDSVFKNAFVAAHKEYYRNDEDKMDNDVVPTRKFLDLIAKKMDVF